MSDSLEHDHRSLGEWKAYGTTLYQSKSYTSAISAYNNAISQHTTTSEVTISSLYFNVAMCYSMLSDYMNAISHCKIALSYDPKYEKAYFRLVKCLLDCHKYQEAKWTLLKSYRMCGETKELRALEIEYNKCSGLILRPSPNCFEVLDDQLGDGNFSKIYKVANKTSDRTIYAMKVIEKPTIEKTRRRHPNVDNEIMMEKKVLARLCHPNIIPLYATFQDQYTLYYQMEYIEGGELWNAALHDTFLDHRAQVGCYQTQAIFIFAELLNAVEHMHGRGVIHRDLKPENILIHPSGHIRVIDFGTAKDIIDTNLNGPDFVGTAEYMSPSTVNGKPSGVECDLWSLGIILYQLLLGYTPFAAPSPFLSFLRIKNAFFKLPAVAPVGLEAMLRILLEKDPELRFQRAVYGYEDDDEVLLESENSSHSKVNLQLQSQPRLSYKNYLGLKNKNSGGTNKQLSSTETTAVTESSTVINDAFTENDRKSSASSIAVSASITTNSINSKAVYYPPRYDYLRLNPLFDCLLTRHPPSSLSSITTIETSLTASTTSSTGNSIVKIIADKQKQEHHHQHPRTVIEDEVDWTTAIQLTAPHALYSATAATTTAITLPTISSTSTNSTLTATLTTSHNASDNKTEASPLSSSSYINTLTTTQQDRIQYLNSLHLHSAIRVPKLSELCIRIVAAACVSVTEAAAISGGLRADNIPWMKDFSLQKLSLINRQRIAHYLQRHDRMHNPSINRLFWNNAVDARSRRADVYLREYLGYSQGTQGHFEKDFTFVIMSEPLFGYNTTKSTTTSSSTTVIAISSATTTVATTAATTAKDNIEKGEEKVQGDVYFCEVEENQLKTAISAINKLRPKFLMVLGNFVAATENGEYSKIATEKFRRMMARVLDTIPVLYVPGSNDIYHSNNYNNIDSDSASSIDNSNSNSNGNNSGNGGDRKSSDNTGMCTNTGTSITDSTDNITTSITSKAPVSSQTIQSIQLQRYHESFGADYYGFWFNGVRCLVLNSTLLCYDYINSNVDSITTSKNTNTSVNTHDDSNSNTSTTDTTDNNNSVRSDTERQALQQAKTIHEEWLSEEIEHAKLSAQHVLIFSYHVWLTEQEAVSQNIDRNRLLPEVVREKWLNKLHHNKVKFIFSSCNMNTPNQIVEKEIKSFPKNKRVKITKREEEGEGMDKKSKKNKKTKKMSDATDSTSGGSAAGIDVDDLQLTTDEMKDDDDEGDTEDDDDDDISVPENIHDDYEGPFVLLTPSVTSCTPVTVTSVSLQHCVKPAAVAVTAITTEASLSVKSSDTHAATTEDDEYIIHSNVDIEDDDDGDGSTNIHTRISDMHQQNKSYFSSDKGIRIVNVTEEDVTQQFYSVSNIPLRKSTN